MSKAEERASEIMRAALDYSNNLEDVKPTNDFNRNLCIALGQAFIKGAEWADCHQAEKDFELTWEDVKAIFLLVQVEWSPNKNEEEIYQEVLKRFNKERNKV